MHHEAGTVWEALLGIAGELDAGQRGEAGDQPIAQGRLLAGAALGQAERDPEAGGAGHALRPGPPLAFLRPALDLGQHGGPLPHEEGPASLGP